MIWTGRAQGLGFRAPGLGFRVPVSGMRPLFKSLGFTAGCIQYGLRGDSTQ